MVGYYKCTYLLFRLLCIVNNEYDQPGYCCCDSQSELRSSRHDLMKTTESGG